MTISPNGSEHFSNGPSTRAEASRLIAGEEASFSDTATSQSPDRIPGSTDWPTFDSTEFDGLPSGEIKEPKSDSAAALGKVMLAHLQPKPGERPRIRDDGPQANESLDVYSERINPENYR
jgi:hypothetical protein